MYIFREEFYTRLVWLYLVSSSLPTEGKMKRNMKGFADNDTKIYGFHIQRK